MIDYDYDVFAEDIDVSKLEPLSTTRTIRETTGKVDLRQERELLDAALLADEENEDVKRAREVVRAEEEREIAENRETERVNGILKSLTPQKSESMDGVFKTLRLAFPFMSPRQRAVVLFELIYAKLFTPQIYKDSKTAPDLIKSIAHHAMSFNETTDVDDAPGDDRFFPAVQSYVRESRVTSAKELPLTKLNKFVEALAHDRVMTTTADLKKRLKGITLRPEVTQILNDTAGRGYENAFTNGVMTRYLIGVQKETKVVSKPKPSNPTSFASADDTAAEDRAERRAQKAIDETDYDKYYEDY
jgi:hypothetical protein